MKRRKISSRVQNVPYLHLISACISVTVIYSKAWIHSDMKVLYFSLSFSYYATYKLEYLTATMRCTALRVILHNIWLSGFEFLGCSKISESSLFTENKMSRPVCRLSCWLNEKIAWPCISFHWRLENWNKRAWSKSWNKSCECMDRLKSKSKVRTAVWSAP